MLAPHDRRPSQAHQDTIEGYRTIAWPSATQQIRRLSCMQLKLGFVSGLIRCSCTFLAHRHLLQAQDFDLDTAARHDCTSGLPFSELPTPTHLAVKLPATCADAAWPHYNLPLDAKKAPCAMPQSCLPSLAAQPLQAQRLLMPPPAAVSAVSTTVVSSSVIASGLSPGTKKD